MLELLEEPLLDAVVLWEVVLLDKVPVTLLVVEETEADVVVFAVVVVVVVVVDFVVVVVVVVDTVVLVDFVVLVEDEVVDEGVVSVKILTYLTAHFASWNELGVFATNSAQEPY